MLKYYGTRAAAAVGVAGALAMTWATAAGAAVIEIKSLTESLTKEIEANLPAILTVVGVLLAITVIVHLARRFAK